jgi:hypothetical protein
LPLYNASLFRLEYFSIHFGRQKTLTLRLSLQHAVLHNDFVVYFHKHAPPSIPEGCFAVAVAGAGTGDDMGQPQLEAGETEVDELVFWQVELNHHRLAVRATKAQPFCSVSMLA